MQHRITHLDGLRGVAAVAVVLSHVAEQINARFPTLALDRMLDFVGFGRIGVVTFFCLSGFVIPFSFRAVKPVQSFAISRFFRLYPAYWLSLAIAALVALPQSYPPLTLLANATMVQSVLRQPDVLGVYWTLFIELVFYGVCVAMFVSGLLARVEAVVLAVVVLCLAAIAAAALSYVNFPVKPPVGIPGYLAIMFFGTVCRYAFLNGERLAIRALPALVVLLVVAITLVALMGYTRGNLPDRPLADWLGVYVGLALFLLAWKAKALLSRPTMIWLGNISYSLYLLHSLCVLGSARLAAHFDAPAVQIAIILAAIPFSMLVAHVSNRFVEQPAIRLGRHVSHRGTTDAPAGA